MAHATEANWRGGTVRFLFVMSIVTLGLGAPLLFLWIWYRKSSGASMMGPECTAATGPTYEPRRSPSGGITHHFGHLHPRFAQAMQSGG
jgi:hypothetical protein